MSKKLTFHSVSGIVFFQSNCHTLIARATELDATSSPFLAVSARKAHVARTFKIERGYYVKKVDFSRNHFNLTTILE